MQQQHITVIQDGGLREICVHLSFWMKTFSFKTIQTILIVKIIFCGWKCFLFLLEWGLPFKTPSVSCAMERQRYLQDTVYLLIYDILSDGIHRVDKEMGHEGPYIVNAFRSAPRKIRKKTD